MKKVYVDPYINRQTGTLKNLLGISDSVKLSEAEAKLSGIAIRKLNRDPIKGDFDFAHLCKIHEKIFEKVYEWAGTQRIIDIEKPERALGGLSVEYSPCDDIQRNASIILADMKKVDWENLPLERKASEFSRYMADLWKIHPFREGNTRTTVTFCCDFAESRGFRLDRKLFKDNSEYTRTALVAASAKFSDLGDHSQPEHLVKIVKDAIERGEKAGKYLEKSKAEPHTQGLNEWEDRINSGTTSSHYMSAPQLEAELPAERE